MYESAKTWTVDGLLGAVPVLMTTGRLESPRRQGGRAAGVTITHREERFSLCFPEPAGRPRGRACFDS